MPIEIEDDMPERVDVPTPKKERDRSRDRSDPPKPSKKELPFKVKRWLTRTMAGCKKATGYTADQIYEMLGL